MRVYVIGRKGHALTASSVVSDRVISNMFASDITPPKCISSGLFEIETRLTNLLASSGPPAAQRLTINPFTSYVNL